MTSMVFATPVPDEGPVPEIVVAPVAVVLVVKYLDQYLADAWRVGTEWEGDQKQVLVSRVGGSRSTVIHDRPQMLLEVFAPTRNEAEDYAQIVEAQIAALPGRNLDVTRVEWLSGPVFYPDAQGRQRVQMSFYLRVRMKGN